MKRIGAILAALLLLSGTLSLAETPAKPEDGEREAEESLLRVGNTTPMSGCFFTDLWGNITSDQDVRDLLHGYNLIMWDGENGMFTTDPSVVSGVAATVDEEGNHTYLLALYDDLKYSDGSRITAWDYAVSYLFSIAPEVVEIGGTPQRREQLLGYRDYLAGKGPLAGVRVLADDMISITLDHEFLPFFYEMSLLSCNPYPISVIAPGVTVKDDGEGVYLTNSDRTVRDPLFSAEMLQKTVMDPDSGYLSHPSVVSGPYTLSSWDGVTAEFEINPNYKGNMKGQKPTIRRLIYTLASNDTMAKQLTGGELDLLNKVVQQKQVMECLWRMQEARLYMNNYPRNGMSFIGFACEKATVSSAAVRTAIALCMDRDKVTSAYTGSFGMRVDGYYGIGQWMYGLIQGTTEPPVHPPEDENDTEAQAAYEAALEAYGELNLDALKTYELDPEQAGRLLESDGWTLNAEGIREKNGVRLELTLLCPEETGIAGTLQTHLADHLAEAGIRLTLNAVPMEELMKAWYCQEDRDADMFYLATNFDRIFDPSVHFQTSTEGKINWSNTRLEDEALYSAALDMRRTEPGDVLTYMQHWVKFQERFNEILPMIPVYSNMYFDFYTDRLRDYAISENSTWSQAIVGAYLYDPESLKENTPEATQDPHP